MNYYNRNGVIGSYQGQEVYVISYKDFAYEMSKENPEMLYAVRRNDGKLDIVEDGMLIGIMTDGGNVETYKWSRRSPYEFYQKEEEVPPTTEKVDVSEGYGYYSQVVDKFFDGLEQLWAEIDASFVESE